MGGVLGHTLIWLRRRWLLVLGAMGFLALLFFRFNEVVGIGATLLRGQWHWVLAAVAIQAVFYVVYSLLYKLCLATVDVRTRLRELVPLLFASLFVKAVVPSGGMSALALFVDDAARSGQSPARTAQGTLLVLAADLVTMIPLILYGLLHLFLSGVLQVYQLVAAGCFLLFTGGLAVVLLMGLWMPGGVQWLTRWAQAVVNGVARLLHRRPFLAPGWAAEQAGEIIGAGRDIAGHPRLLLYTLVVAFGVHLINAGCLYAIALAYHWALSLGTLMAAFSLDAVFSVVTFIPFGIGMAEAAMALVLGSLGGSKQVALATTIAFRGLNVWLPLFIGFFLLRRVRAFGGRRRADGSSQTAP